MNVWREVFKTAATANGPPAEIVIDGAFKAQRAVGGGRRGSSKPEAPTTGI